MYYAVLVLFVVVSLLLIGITLLQKGSGGMGAAFGSGMGQSVFGAGGMDTILTKITYWLGAAFLILAIILSVMPKGQKESVIKRVEPAPQSKPVEQKEPEPQQKTLGQDNGERAPKKEP